MIPLPATKTQTTYEFEGEAAAIAMRILGVTMEGKDGVATTRVSVSGFGEAKRKLRSQGYGVEVNNGRTEDR